MASGKVSLLYDGQCGLCLRILEWIARLDPSHLMRFLDTHDEAVRHGFPTIDPKDLDRAMYAVTQDGREFRGFHAFRLVARLIPCLWILLPLFYLPGSAYLGTKLYDWVARRRRSLGCSPDRCDLGRRHG